MNSKNKYFKYKGNYYTSKEYIALKNKEIITQSGGVPLLAYKNTMNKFSVDKDKREKKGSKTKPSERNITKIMRICETKATINIRLSVLM